jgi:hypothetical protein
VGLKSWWNAPRPSPRSVTLAGDDLVREVDRILSWASSFCLILGVCLVLLSLPLPAAAWIQSAAIGLLILALSVGWIRMGLTSRDRNRKLTRHFGLDLRDFSGGRQIFDIVLVLMLAAAVAWLVIAEVQNLSVTLDSVPQSVYRVSVDGTDTVLSVSKSDYETLARFNPWTPVTLSWIFINYPWLMSRRWSRIKRGRKTATSHLANATPHRSSRSAFEA